MVNASGGMLITTLSRLSILIRWKTACKSAKEDPCGQVSKVAYVPDSVTVQEQVQGYTVLLVIQDPFYDSISPISPKSPRLPAA